VEKARASLIADEREMSKKLGFIESCTELVGEGFLFRNDPDLFVKLAEARRKLTPQDITKATARLLKRPASKLLVISSQNCDVPKFCK